MGISKGCVFKSIITTPGVGLRLLNLKANILIKHDGHACIADFGLFVIISDHTSCISTISNAEGGTTQWMSPELLDPERFGLNHSCPTKESDCYALAMVIYEVLSGQAPFAGCKGATVIWKVMDGKRPERPQGRQAAWFTDGLWDTLELCWKPRPYDRPSLKTLLQCLEGVTRPLPSSSTSAASEGVVTGNDDRSDSTVTVNPGMFSISSKASGQPLIILVVWQG